MKKQVNLLNKQTIKILFFFFIITNTYSNDKTSNNFKIQAGTLLENNEALPYYYTSYQSKQIKGGIFKKDDQFFFEAQAKYKNNYLSIEAGNLSNSLIDGFYISNGGYLPNFQTFSYKQPIGLSVINQFHFLKIENNYYINQQENFIDENKNNQEENNNLNEENSIQIHKLKFFIQKQTFYINFGIQKIIYNNNSSLYNTKSVSSNLDEKIAFFFNYNQKFSFMKLKINAHHSNYYGYSTLLKISSKNVFFNIQYFNKKSNNKFSSQIYQVNSKGFIGIFKSKFFQCQHFYNKQKNKIKIFIPLKIINPFYYYYSNQKQIYGITTEIPITYIKIISSFYKELKTKTYFFSAGIQALKILKISFLYFKNCVNKYEQYFPVNPNFFQKELYVFNINEDNLLYYNKSYIGIQSSLHYNDFYFTFLILDFTSKVKENEKRNIAFYRIGYTHKF